MNKEAKLKFLNQERMRFGHRWTHEELKSLIQLWDGDVPVTEIAKCLGSTEFAIGHMITRLRSEGIPLKRRTRGRRLCEMRQGRRGHLWTQAEVDYLVTRRRDRATQEEIAAELGRSWVAVAGMIQRLRKLGLAVPRFGQGMRKLYDVNSLRINYGTNPNFESDDADTKQYGDVPIQ